jgi:hypothetical protein
MIIEKLLVAITFHYDETRFGYLRSVCHQIPFLAADYRILIVTNAQQICHNKIREQLDGIANYEIISYSTMGHPFFLTWGHLPIFKHYFLHEISFTHFMYLEDDIQITPHNVNYWIRGRHELLDSGFYPSFIRYEVNIENNFFVATDVTRRLKLKRLPQIAIAPCYVFVNLPQPYQGMYLMDRIMMSEYFNSPGHSPDFGSWGIREKATQGLTFVAVPKPFFSRNLLGYNLSKKSIDSGALIEHLPGNYASNSKSLFGKMPIENLIEL